MLAPKTKVVPTPKAANPSAVDLDIIQHAIREAQSGLEQGTLSFSVTLKPYTYSRSQAESRSAQRSTTTLQENS